MIARAAAACMSSGNARRAFTASSISLVMVVRVGALAQQLQQRDREGGGTKAVGDQNAAEVFI